MQRVRLLLAVPVACAFACGDATQPAPSHTVPLILPSVTAVTDGPASGVGCVYGENLWADGGPTGHFDTVGTTLSDSSACGALGFGGGTRTFNVTYALAGGDETPYAYWFRGSRDRENGSYALDTLLERDSVADHDTIETGPLPMLLDGDYDAVGAALFLWQDTTLEASEEGFADPSGTGRNYSLQLWAAKDPPVWDSASASGLVVTLWWQNRHAGRTNDSTVVFRNGVHRATVNQAQTSFTDTVSGRDTWEYSLKHVAAPVMGDPLVSPNSPSSDTVAVEVGTACARLVESDSSYATWKQTDQYLSAGCSELGANKRFRWYKAGDMALSSWSNDTLFDFLGHADTSAPFVYLKDWNTTTNDSTSRDTLWFSVANDEVILSGPTFITDKQQKVYWADSSGTDSTHAGQWFERYDDGPQWDAATAYEQDTLLRIWPYGEYTVDLRQHTLALGTPRILQRGRLFIEVCSGSACEDPSPPAMAPAPGRGDGWEVFGAGPWIGWGGAERPQALRFYDLWGMPDRPGNPFVAVGWLTGAGGTVLDAVAGWQLDWAPDALSNDTVRAFAFQVSGDRGRPYVFSMAVDPDLGPDGADDVASYDAARGMVIVADGDRAVGLLLRAGARNALASVQEYGVGRWAPAVPAGAWTAQRDAGIHLRGTPRDVQLVLSAAETTGPAVWRFVVIRGASRAAVQKTADEVLRALR